MNDRIKLRLALVLLILSFALPLCVEANSEGACVDLELVDFPQDSDIDMKESKSKQFTALFFDQGVQATYLGFLYSARLPAPEDGPWTHINRYWSEESWANDIAAFAWVGEDRALIATSSIYGSGDVYLVDPLSRTSRVIFESPGIPEEGWISYKLAPCKMPGKFCLTQELNNGKATVSTEYHIQSNCSFTAVQ